VWVAADDLEALLREHEQEQEQEYGPHRLHGGDAS
jgi:hypothetical protein